MNNLVVIKKACFSGYRPQKFEFKLNSKCAQYNQLRFHINETLSSLIENGCTVFYCGMAAGFDIIAAECVLAFKKINKNIRLVCAIPYLGHDKSLNEEWHKRYNKVILHSDEIVYTSDCYHPACFSYRNRYMVDVSDCVICWYDGKTGGTLNTIKYANKSHKYIININTEYNANLNNIQNKIEL